MRKAVKLILTLPFTIIVVYLFGMQFGWFPPPNIAIDKITSISVSSNSEAIPVTPNPDVPPGLDLVDGRVLDPLEIEPWIVSYTNAERQHAGLAPLTENPIITAIARAHSENMVAQDTQSHVLDGLRATDRASRAGYNCGLAENIGRVNRVTEWLGYGGNYRPSRYRKDEEQVAKAFVASWMDSAGHRENILDSSKRSIGVGVAVSFTEKHEYAREQFWATQNFTRCK